MLNVLENLFIFSTLDKLLVVWNLISFPISRHIFSLLWTVIGVLKFWPDPLEQSCFQTRADNEKVTEPQHLSACLQCTPKVMPASPLESPQLGRPSAHTLWTPPNRYSFYTVQFAPLPCALYGCSCLCFGKCVKFSCASCTHLFPAAPDPGNYWSDFGP